MLVEDGFDVIDFYVGIDFIVEWIGIGCEDMEYLVI